MNQGEAVPQQFLEELYAIPGNRVTIRRFISQASARRVTVLAGNGLSEGAGLPGWNPLIARLAQGYGVEHDDPEVAAGRLLDKVGDLLFYDLIEDAFTSPQSHPRQWHGSIRVLPYLAERIISLNVDTALEAMYAFVGSAFKEVYRWDHSLGVAPPPVLWKVLGSVDDRSVLANKRQRDEAELRINAESCSSFVSGSNLLAVGFRFRDFSASLCRTILRSVRVDSFVALEMSEAYAARELSELRVRPIHYPAFAGAGEELLLRHLVELLPPDARPHPPRELPPYAAAEAPVREAVSAAPAPETPQIDVPEELVSSCLAGECVLFAGSGLSARAGIPTWHQFLTDAIAHAREHRVIDESYARSLAAALEAGDRDSTADGLAQAFGERRQLLHEFLARYFPETTPLAPAHNWLREIPFASVVTTNYDTLLERTFPEYASSGKFIPRDAGQLLDALAQKQRFILKLYGLLDRPETLIFAPIEYREAVSSNIDFARFMEGFLFSRTFLFLGLSLEGLQEFLAGFVFRGTSPRKHFALVAVSGSAWRARAELLQRRYNIHVIAFPVSPSFGEVDQFVEKLSRAARVAPGPKPQAGPADESAGGGIRRVVLEDIGPFERLEVELPKERNWKILLGDNGVGKSTILKAIAVAIMGSDARSYAARLVRAGKTRGRITLITDKNPSGYVTDILTKDMLSEAEVVSLPTRPMEAEGWLALGFSPLRVVTWTGSTGPQPIVQRGRPTADDLLPLISGESDPRMDRLKQWIVNLDAADKPGQTRALLGHTDRVMAVQFSPDGGMLVSGSIDRTVRFWDWHNGAEIRKIDAHRGGVNAISLSADGKLIATGSYDRSAKTWMPDGMYRLTYPGSQSQVLSVALSADGRVLASGSQGGSLRLYDVRSGDEMRRIDTGGGAVWSLAWRPHGKQIAVGSDDGGLRIYDAETGRLEGRAQFDSSARALAWTRGGGEVIVGSTDGSVAIEGSGRRALGRLPAGVMAVSCSPDGDRVAAGAKNGMVAVWEIESGREVARLQAHPDAVWSVAFSPDGRTLATASSDKSIRLWNVPADPGAGEQETIRRFFRLFGVLTDRTDIDFLEVTRDFRVMVRVAGTAVPLEVLSQGMTSLLGWIGVLCQRLKETLPDPTRDPLPTSSYALVLIDELDAHMHPQWQQVLVHRLKTMFPRVQFVASTHSPLIVGGLDPEDVDRFALQGGKVKRVEFDADMTLGRTDQILTGELFGLETTLDPVTRELMDEYEDLLGDPDQDRERFRELGRMLEERIPPTPSEPVKRRARELLEALQAVEEEGKQARVDERMARLAKALKGEDQ